MWHLLEFANISDGNDDDETIEEIVVSDWRSVPTRMGLATMKMRDKILESGLMGLEFEVDTSCQIDGGSRPPFEL